MRQQGRPRDGNWAQPKAQINKQVPGAEAVLRSNWEVNSKFKIRTRSTDGYKGQEPIE